MTNLALTHGGNKIGVFTVCTVVVAGAFWHYFCQFALLNLFIFCVMFSIPIGSIESGTSASPGNTSSSTPPPKSSSLSSLPTLSSLSEEQEPTTLTNWNVCYMYVSSMGQRNILRSWQNSNLWPQKILVWYDITSTTCNGYFGM